MTEYMKRKRIMKKIHKDTDKKKLNARIIKKEYNKLYSNVTIKDKYRIDEDIEDISEYEEIENEGYISCLENLD